MKNNVVSWLIILLLVLQVAFSVVLVIKLNRLTDAMLRTPVTEITSVTPVYIGDISVDDDPVRGNPETTKVLIVEFADYECPFCAQASSVIESILKENSENVAFVIRDYPLPSHPHAFKAAEAANCAGDQDKYWEMHDLLFANQEQLDTESLRERAVILGLDLEKFNECLESGKHEDEIMLDIEEGQKYQIPGAPAFIVNGYLVDLNGLAQTTEEFLRRKE